MHPDADELAAASSVPIDPDVRMVLDSYPDAVREGVLRLRRLILDTAARTEGVGRLEESLRWGQPSYLTSETGSGSTVRIAALEDGRGYDYAMHFICRTSLVETFRQLFGDVLATEGDRSLLFRVGDAIPEDALRRCVAMALTYHRSRS